MGNKGHEHRHLTFCRVTKSPTMGRTDRPQNGPYSTVTAVPLAETISIDSPDPSAP
jgi:hypothetical protein